MLMVSQKDIYQSEILQPENGIKNKLKQLFSPSIGLNVKQKWKLKVLLKIPIRIPNTEMWRGTSSSGVKMEGYYKKPDGSGATAWPIYEKK